MMETTAPILPIRDQDLTAAFYGSIGFVETGRWLPPIGYLIMTREKIEIHFNLRKDLVPLEHSGAVYIRTDDVDGFSEEVAALGLPSDGFPGFCPAADMSWGMREASILDPDGNLLRIGQFVDG